jgi:hypothetical protein
VQAQLRSEREERRRRFEGILDPELEALAEALIAKALEGDVGVRRDAQRPRDRLAAQPELRDVLGLRRDLLVERHGTGLDECGLKVDLRSGSNSLRPRPRAEARARPHR